jgi:hypothetical protein
VSDDKASVFGGRIRLGRAPAAGELLVGDGAGFGLTQSNFVFDGDRVGISRSPEAKLDILSSRTYGDPSIDYNESTLRIAGNADEYPRLEVQAFGGVLGYEQGEVVFRRAHGPRSAPTEPASGNNLGVLIGRAWNASLNGFATAGQITFVQSGAAMPNGVPGDVLISTNNGTFGQFGAAEGFRLNKDGQVTLAQQPAFCATASYGDNYVGDLNPVVFGDVLANRGSHYNASNGRFTAPTSGIYGFFMRGIKRPESGSLYVDMYINDATLISEDYSEIPQWSPVVMCANVFLNAGDNVRVAMYSTAGAANYLSGRYWTFMGQLLG